MTKVRILKVKPLMSVKDSDKMAGKFLTENDCKILIREDADVYDAETGACLARFRRNVIPGKIQVDAYESLLNAAKATDNRGISTGEAEVLAEDGKALVKRKIRKKLKNGRMSKTNVAAGGAVNSGIIGYFDRGPRFPYCRLTAFNQYEFAKFKKAYPVIKLVNTLYEKFMPKEYGRQLEIVNKTSPDFVIRGTVFTTVTVNKNWQTAVHKDKGDFREGFGNLTALRKGTFTGGHFVLVRWGVGFDMQNGDVLFTNVHEWHGNTPIIKDDPKAVRLSLVMYYRENMVYCKSMEEELKKVKNRQYGTTLKD